MIKFLLVPSVHFAKKRLKMLMMER